MGPTGKPGVPGQDGKRGKKGDTGQGLPGEKVRKQIKVFFSLKSEFANFEDLKSLLVSCRYTIASYLEFNYKDSAAVLFAK